MHAVLDFIPAYIFLLDGSDYHLDIVSICALSENDRLIELLKTGQSIETQYCALALSYSASSTCLLLMYANEVDRRPHGTFNLLPNAGVIYSVLVGIILFSSVSLFLQPSANKRVHHRLQATTTS